MGVLLLPYSYPVSRSTTTGDQLFTRTLSASSQAVPSTLPKGYDLELFSPAKVNLFLRIIRRREDGYHELASLFQTVAFGDTLLFKVSKYPCDVYDDDYDDMSYKMMLMKCVT